MIFLVRVSLALVIAFVLTRFFFGRTAPIKVFAFAALLLGLAYFFEYLRKKNSGGEK